MSRRSASILVRSSTSVAGATSRHVIRCGQASQRHSVGALPLRYHVTRRGFSGCFAGAWWRRFGGRLCVRVGASDRLNESNHPVDIARGQASKSQAEALHVPEDRIRQQSRSTPRVLQYSLTFVKHRVHSIAKPSQTDLSLVIRISVKPDRLLFLPLGLDLHFLLA